MIKHTLKRGLSLFLACMMVLMLLPAAAFAAGEDGNNSSGIQKTADASTLDSYTSILGEEDDGGRYAGRVWTDKSVLTDITNLTLDGKSLDKYAEEDGFDSVSLEDDEFLTVFSALGSSRTDSSVAEIPLDVVLVIDVSTSMANTQRQEDSRIYRSVEALNRLIENMMKQNENSRVGVVAYSETVTTIMPLAHYNTPTNGKYLTLSGYDYHNGQEGRTFTVTANVGEQTSVTAQKYTYTQAGLYTGMELLAKVTDTKVSLSGGVTVDRMPVVILVSDGVPTSFGAPGINNNTNDTNTTPNTDWWDFSADNTRRGTQVSRPARLLATLLTASYEKNKIEENYKVSPKVFTIGINLGEDEEADYGKALLDPEACFTDSVLVNSSITEENTNLTYKNALSLAYSAWKSYQNGDTPKLLYRSKEEGNDRYTYYSYYYCYFNHPATDDVTSVNYVDQFFDISDNADELYEAFSAIFTDITSKAFVPTQDATGQNKAGILYTDPIGEYMEVKSVNGVLINGKVVPLEKSTTEDTWTATIPVEDASTGKTQHPIYGVDIAGKKITIKVTKDNTNQEILTVEVPSEVVPAQCETVNVASDGTITVSRDSSMPLRVLYTVGLSKDIENSDGTINRSEVSTDYIKAHTATDANGNKTVSFYSNAYSTNTQNEGVTSTNAVSATAQFTPATNNRFYYFQNNRVVYSEINTNDIVKDAQNEAVHAVYDDNNNLVEAIVDVSDDTAVNSGWTAVSKTESLDDNTTYYLIIDYYRPEGGTVSEDEDGNVAGEHVYLVVARTGQELQYSTDDSQGDYLVTKTGTPRLGYLNQFQAKKDNNATNTNPYYYDPCYNISGSSETPNLPDPENGNYALTVNLGNNGQLTVPAPKYKVTVEYYLENSTTALGTSDLPSGAVTSISGLSVGGTWNIDVSDTTGTDTAPKTITVSEKTYAFDSIATGSAPLSGTIGNADVTVKLVYSADEIGSTDPETDEDTGDGIPDKYQATIKYVSAEGGSITSTPKTEVLTIYAEGSTTKYAESGTVEITGAEATANANYSFSNWSNDKNINNVQTDGSALSKQDISVNGGDVITFTANWTKDAAPEVTEASKTITKINNEDVTDVESESVQAGDVISYQVSFSSQARYFSVTDDKLPSTTDKITVTVDEKTVGGNNIALENNTLTVSLDEKPETGSVVITYSYTVTDVDMTETSVKNTATIQAWNDENTKGEPENNPTVEVDIDKYDITKIEKELVESVDDVPAGLTASDYDYPNSDETVVVPSSGVTLLYKITVTGDAGAKFTVADQDATLVSSDNSITQDTTTNEISGTIPADGESVSFYVTKDFAASDIKESQLTNTATVNPGDNAEIDDPENPGKTELTDTAETPAETVGVTVTKAPVTETSVTNVTTNYTPVTEKTENGVTTYSVTAPESGNSITLLYAVTVTATGETTTTVELKDTGAKYAGNDATDGSKYTVEAENDSDTATVKFTAADTAKVYFAKTFDLSTTTSLSNSVTYKVDNDPGEETTNSDPVTVYYTITATAGGGGSINPSGDATVAAGGNQSYTITPDNGYKIDKVTVDNEEVTITDNTYTFNNVQKNHKINVTFVALNTKVEVTKELTSVGGENDFTAGVPMAQVGDTITWTIKVENTGETNLTGLSLTDSIDGVKLTNEENNIDLNSFNLNAGDSVTFTATYTVVAGDEGKTLKNSVNVKETDSEDPIGSDDSDKDVTVEKKDLSVTKSVDTTSIKAGNTLTYTITVTNTGNVALNNIKVTDTLKDAGGSVTFTASDIDAYKINDDGTVTINTLEANHKVTITATYKVLSTDAGKTITNTATAQVGEDGPSATSDEVTTTVSKSSSSHSSKPTTPVTPPVLNTEDHVAYIIGYEDGTVRPANNITRAEVATIFFRLLTDESRAEIWSTTNDYSDVAGTAWYNNAISTLSNAGIITGYEDGTFRPDASITRAEFATIAARFSDVVYDGSNGFTDVPDTHWAARYIALAQHLGWINGYEDNTFRPEQYITRAESMTLVNRVLERAVEEEHMLPEMMTWVDNQPGTWYYEAVQEATNSHEYTRLDKVVPDQDFCYEDWQQVLKAPSWALLERTWSTANGQH